MRLSTALLSALLATTSLAALAPAPAMAVSQADASAYITKISNQALDVLAKNKEREAMRAGLETLFNDAVDIDWVSRFVLGRYWRTLTPEQQAQYREAYRRFLVEHYSANFTDYTQGTSVKVTRTTPQARDEQLVATSIVRPGKEPINVEYRVHDAQGGPKIIDVVVEGVSLITTQRSEFASVMQRENFDYLLKQIQARTEAEKSGKVKAAETPSVTAPATAAK